MYSLSYLQHHDSDWSDLSIMSQSPDFKKQGAFWIVFFVALVPILRYVTSKLFPRYYQGLGDKKREDLLSYALSFVHHSVVIPWGVYYMYLDATLSPDERRAFNFAKAFVPIVPFILGYFVADTVAFALPSALKGNAEFLAHHLLSFVLIFTAADASGPTVRFVPHIFICEISSMIFAISFFVRTVTDAKNPPFIVPLLEYAFALTFVLSRCVNLPAILVVLRGERHTYPVMCYTLYAIQVLQFFWLYKIVAALSRKKKSRAKGKGKRDEEEDEDHVE